MNRNEQPPADAHAPASGPHRTESQDPQTAARRAAEAGGDPTGDGHEVRVRSNYQTPLGDVAAAADAAARKQSEDRHER
jgi:hypothetical protein